MKIYYKDGYKYQLAEEFIIALDWNTGKDCINEFINLSAYGSIKKGYAWDGCSGPSWDDNTNMRGGLVHDALYQLMRAKTLDLKYREKADKTLYDVCRLDGMNIIRAKAYYFAVRKFAAFAAKKERKILTAP